MYEISYSPKAQATYDAAFKRASRGKPTPLDKQLFKALDLLRNDPSHPSLQVHRHHNFACWEAYIQRSWRIFFDYTGKNTIAVLLITAHP
jgi:hypothetical protein